MGRTLLLRLGVNITLLLRHLHACQTLPAWGTGALLPPRWDFVPISHVQTCWDEGSAGWGWRVLPSLKTPLLWRLGGLWLLSASINSLGWGQMWSWALHGGPVTCRSNLRGAGAAQQTVILISVTSGPSDTHPCPHSRWAQSSQRTFDRDIKNKKPGFNCSAGKQRLQLRRARERLSSAGACCIGDTNICGASWVCAVKAALLLYANEWSRAKQGQKKPEEEFQPGGFLSGERT